MFSFTMSVLLVVVLIVICALVVMPRERSDSEIIAEQVRNYEKGR